MSRPRRRWLIGAALLAGAGAVTVLVLILEGGPASGGNAAAVGNRRFAHAAASCAPSESAEPSPSALPSLLLGISASLRLERGADQCEQARLAAQTGARAVREDISWALTEPHQNEYDWSGYDAVVRTATEAGLLVLPILDDPPAWASGGQGCLPSDPAAYAAFTAATVARYGPGGVFWRANPELPERPLEWYELWNEPWTACNGTPATYARLVLAAVTSARFLIGADTSVTLVSGGQVDWIAGLYAAVPDLGRYFDAVSVHPYGGNPDVYTPGGDTENQPARLEQVHAELAAHGDGDKPLWVTEIGWSTCSGASECVTEAEQAQYLEEFLHDAVTIWRSYVRAVFVYDLRDIAPAPADDQEAWFGLLRPDLSRKPAWTVLHDFAEQLGG
jgi:polysaccharide biosynthesis protein PslG